MCFKSLYLSAREVQINTGKYHRTLSAMIFFKEELSLSSYKGYIYLKCVRRAILFLFYANALVFLEHALVISERSVSVHIKIIAISQ